jgi:RimJ/RimL family protein N-acetyltransferase
MYGPVIEGKLVRLRPPSMDDAAAIITWFEDMEVTRFLQLKTPPSLEYEKEWLDRMARDLNFLMWVVEYEGRAAGMTGIHEINWKEGWGTTGTIVGDKSVWGKGLGRELMQLRTNYAFTQTPLRKLKSAYADGNEASARAQAASGYRVVGRYQADRFADGRWRDEILTEVMREDWAKAYRAKPVSKPRRTRSV